jgi:hypothetical protein
MYFFYIFSFTAHELDSMGSIKEKISIEEKERGGDNLSVSSLSSNKNRKEEQGERGGRKRDTNSNSSRNNNNNGDGDFGPPKHVVNEKNSKRRSTSRSINSSHASESGIFIIVCLFLFR